jgi:cobalt/nickel transport system ATP-binding protein
MIKFDNISVKLADGTRVVRDLSWTVAAGNRVGLVGPNGAGKTSLLMAMCGVLAPCAGRGWIADRDLADPKARKALRGSVGLLFQDPDDQLLEASVEDDICLGPLLRGVPETEARKIARKAMERLGIHDWAMRVPQRLSLGEKKRVALAGVLALDPCLILLDEPTAGLDPRGRRELIELIRGLEKTLIVATHDLELVHDICPDVALIDQGSIVTHGPSSVVLADAELMRAHGLEVPWPLR